MRETTPSIYLIAEPKINWDEVERYLDEVGGLAWLNRVRPTVDPRSMPSHPEYDPSFVGLRPKPVASGAELLAEFAGRGCYRSWAPELNANVTKVREDSGEYLDNILKSKHGAVLEHAQFTFQFHNVSRVFTHELVRHRAGVAISQESLRYVRLTDLGFRIPEILNRDDMRIPARFPGPCNFADAELEGAEATADYCYAHQNFCQPDGTQNFRNAVVSIVERLEEFQRDAAEAFGLDDEGTPFHVKKEVTSALRRLAPIGLSTGMTWSANVRTLRHVIAQRTAPGAEEEIRLVFDQVCRRMRAECPLLFGDFEPHDLEGRPLSDQILDPTNTLVPAWVPKYEKV